jgi:hypothetical protein
VCAINLGLVTGQGDHSSISAPMDGTGAGTGGSSNRSGNVFT